MDRIALKYPIFGVIGKFEDQNDVTSARPAVAEATGFANESNSFLNYIQMFMTDIQSGQNLNYLVYYTPTQWPAFMMGTDRYQLSYIWEFQGQRIEEVEWRWVKDDRIAPMPAGIVEAAQITPHSLTPDQINQELQEELQEGISKRPLQ